MLHETYNFKFKPFAANRFLRLYPAYFIIASISLLFAITFESYKLFHVSWAPSASISDIAGNIFMFPWAFLADDIAPVNFLQIDILHSETPHFRLVPSTWSVDVEIACYFLLWLFTARHIWTTIASITIAIAWQWYVLHSPVNQLLGYFPITAALLPFGIGALAYHIVTRTNIKPLNSMPAIFITIAACFLFILNWKISTESSSFIGSTSYYANNALAFLIVTLINRTQHSGGAKTVDKWLGDLAYPMFLGQYVFGFIAWKTLGIESSTRSLEVFALGSTITIIASIVIVHIVDKRIMRVRHNIRVAIEADAKPKTA